jgi:hypothetical protein
VHDEPAQDLYGVLHDEAAQRHGRGEAGQRHRDDLDRHARARAV